jgi:hypothetical protein
MSDYLSNECKHGIHDRSICGTCQRDARIAKLETSLLQIRDAKFYASTYDINCTTDNLRGYANRLQLIAAKALENNDA